MNTGGEDSSHQEPRASCAGGRRERALFSALAELCACFAIPTRLELLDVLAQTPCTVEELARASGLVDRAGSVRGDPVATQAAASSRSSVSARCWWDGQ